MMKFFDGEKILEIEIKDWDGNGYSPSYENDILADFGRYDEDNQVYMVDDVEDAVIYAYDIYNDGVEDQHKLDYHDISCPQYRHIINEDVSPMCLIYNLDNA